MGVNVRNVILFNAVGVAIMAFLSCGGGETNTTSTDSDVTAALGRWWLQSLDGGDFSFANSVLTLEAATFRWWFDDSQCEYAGTAKYDGALFLLSATINTCSNSDNVEFEGTYKVIDNDLTLTFSSGSGGVAVFVRLEDEQEPEGLGGPAQSAEGHEGDAVNTGRYILTVNSSTFSITSPGIGATPETPDIDGNVFLLVRTTLYNYAYPSLSPFAAFALESPAGRIYSMDLSHIFHPDKFDDTSSLKKGETRAGTMVFEVDGSAGSGGWKLYFKRGSTSVPSATVSLVPTGDPGTGPRICSSSCATTGACSSHGGVDCSAGPDYDGSVICEDGWKESSVGYSCS